MNKSTDSEIYLSEDCRLIGDVTLGPGSSVWYFAVIRGDNAPVTIGSRTNIQENCTIHTNSDHPVRIGNDVTIGHGAIIHGCTIGSNTTIGMGSTILNGAVIGHDCIIGAGSLVTQGKVIPDNSIVFGNPAKFFRSASEADREANRRSAEEYEEMARKQFSR